MPVAVPAAYAGDPVAVTVDLIKKVNIHEFAKTFAPTIDLTIADEENIYSATQAEQVLESFFKNIQVKSVKVLHKVNSNPSIRFTVLQVDTNNGNYRVSLSMKLVNGQYLVNELRIETEKKE
jgi:hypothetical protein